MVATRRAYQPQEPRLPMPGTPSGRAQTRGERAAHRRLHLRSHRPHRPRPHQLATRPNAETHRMNAAALIAARDRHTAPMVSPARHLLSAKDLADARYFERLAVSDLARAAGLSEAHFSREFRHTFGESPHAYLLTRRLERAAALLRMTDHSVAEICFSVGLQSVGSFTSSFPRTYGCSPSASRRRFPPAATHAQVPTCIVRAFGRPQHRRFREDSLAAAD